MRLACEAGDFAGRQSVGGLGRKVKEHDYVGYMEAFALEKKRTIERLQSRGITASALA